MDDEVNQVCREARPEDYMSVPPPAPAPAPPPPNRCVQPPAGANGTTSRGAAPFVNMYDGPSVSSLSPGQAARDREYTRQQREREEYTRELLTGQPAPGHEPNRQIELWRELHRHPVH